MKKISIIIGIIGLVAIGWFLVHESSIDYVATVDDELSKLERELAALDASGFSAADAAAAKDKIAARLGTIQSSLTASQERGLTAAQQQMLQGGLTRLQSVLRDNQAALAALDQTADGLPSDAVGADSATIAALAETIITIQQYLDVPKESVALTARDATYTIEGTAVTLVDGVSVTQVAPDSAVTVETTYFGNEVVTDLNDDGRLDVVFLLTQSTGGSGTFFYVVAALSTEDGWKGSDGFLLGDRIAPQTTELSQNPNHKHVVVVNYLDREVDQSMAEQPSVGQSVWLKLDVMNMSWGEVVQDFEGEANPDVMTLGMKPWTWVQTTYMTDSVVVPTQPNAFTLTFEDDGVVAITTDCNTMGGSYVAEGNAVSFGPLMATRMFCEDSQEQDFATMLEQIQSYSFTSKGELIFELGSAGAVAVFR